ncbi:hypothetical protein DL93DRAFT_2061489 [Clavulina sp. PMI_390]|nr:hypothetical protein DL93DRAFT_2061489 [Clavulina sp. PMI_390]
MAQRRQNSACDQCRNRKVKCNIMPGEDKCQHCVNKNYQCTFVAQQETEKKRSVTGRRLDRARLIPSHPGGLQSTARPSAAAQYPYPGLPPPPTAPIQDFLAYLFAPDPTQPLEYNGANQEYLHARRRLQEPDYRVEFATELLEVYFQVYHPRVPIVNPTRFRAQLREALYGPVKERSNSDGAPPAKRMRMGDDGAVSSASSSFAEGMGASPVNGEGSPANSANGASSLRPINRPLLACLLAWGSKFSDHALLVMDRAQGSRETTSPMRSNISRLLVDRAREVSEQEKVYRIAKPENVVVCMLMEAVQPLQSCEISFAYPTGIKCFWINAGIRHLLELGVNHHPSDPIPAGQHTGDPDDWSCMVFCWWLACISDALCSLYFHKKPLLSEEDYDLKEFQLITEPPAPSSESGMSDPAKERAAAQEQALWYSSAHDLAVDARNMARTLFTPHVMKWGIPHQVVTTHVAALTKWRDQHLGVVGANNDLQNIGDYVAAVTACTIDCSYHVMWIELVHAISDYGIKEINLAVEKAREDSQKTSMFSALADMLDTERMIATEAFKSATRIAGLAGVLTTNGYMRLDPNAMHWPIYTAGRLLATMGRPEVENCIAGLNQNGYAYDGESSSYYIAIHELVAYYHAWIQRRGCIPRA